MAILQMTINVGDTRERQWFSCHKLEGNWIVDWGDGCIEVNTEYHTYKQAGIYQITVKGEFILDQLECPGNTISLDREEGCDIVDLDFCFDLCRELISVPHDWDVSKVTEMRSMFLNCEVFNQDLSHWNLKEVATRDMFYNCQIEEKHKPKGLR